MAITITIGKPSALSFNLGNINIGNRLPSYDGSYTITPRVYEQTLETNKKSMEDDVTCLQIPLSQAQNPQGGYTATIG